MGNHSDQEISVDSGNPLVRQQMMGKLRITYGNTGDVEIAGVKWVRCVLRTELLKSHIVSEDGPGESCQTDDILAFLATTGLTMCHPVGTCKMGPDAMAVVDERLCVRSVASLRVMDASIMPIITSGKTVPACYMIAEMGAGMIKADQTPKGQQPYSLAEVRS